MFFTEDDLFMELRELQRVLIEIIKFQLSIQDQEPGIAPWKRGKRGNLIYESKYQDLIMSNRLSAYESYTRALIESTIQNSAHNIKDLRFSTNKSKLFTLYLSYVTTASSISIISANLNQVDWSKFPSDIKEKPWEDIVDEK